MEKIQKSEAEWKKELTQEEYRILREKGTEAAGTGKYYHTKDKGVYRCAACGTELFSSETKYESGSGWPSFYAPISEDRVRERDDTSHGMRRTEALCNVCDSHLGHVFPDGPEPTGERFCVNSASLDLDKAEK